jgi:branched-subunit amino acid aminotransferase/4-amino-4-deoxychorismate lyase
MGLPPEKLALMQGSFVSLSSWGIVEVSHLDGRELQKSPITARLRIAYEELMQAETS